MTYKNNEQPKTYLTIAWNTVESDAWVVSRVASDLKGWTKLDFEVALVYNRHCTRKRFGQLKIESAFLNLGYTSLTN